MINAAQAFQRIRKLKAFSKMQPTDFRAAYYAQTFTPASGGTPTANQLQQFPGGAIILGITASAYVPGVAANGGQSARNRQLFSIDFSYSNNEALVIGGPVNADALLGGGDADVFPATELIMAPNQSINCRVANLTTGSLVVHVVYHCLVYRFAS
jgi:hypothetical protein